MEEEFAESAVIKEGETGTLEIELMELTVEPLIHKLSGLVVAVYVEELVVDEERNDVVHVALVYDLIDRPNPKVDFTLVGLVRCFIRRSSVEELVEPSFENPGNWWAIHLLLQGLDRLVRSGFIQHMPFSWEFDHIRNANLIAFCFQP